MPQNPSLDAATVEAKRERLTALIARRLSGPRDLASIRSDVDRLPEATLDDLLAHYRYV